ncbi:MAG: hypothetical protein HY906_13310 [Deltaproteobacteria bacterium]|nr:hypothetical protein [Deltaproteobacteria bacterium]
MVDRLGRWLRLLGEDVAPAPTSTDDLCAAAAAGRVVLTRDTRLRARLETAGLPVLFVEDDRIDDQLRQIDRTCGLGGAVPFSRCSRCNTVLTFHDPAEVAGEVWPHVARTQPRIGHCPTCGRHYWQASHLGRMAAFLRRVLGRDLLGTA